MTEENKTLRDFLPQRLRENYDTIRNLETVSTGVLNVAEIEQMQHLLNDAQPKNHEEELMRTTLQFLYRRNSAEFYKYLVKSRLYHLVLWTEAKRMSRHFRLNNLIYIHWNGNSYECSQHSNFGRFTHGQEDREDQDGQEDQEPQEPQELEERAPRSNTFSRPRGSRMAPTRTTLRRTVSSGTRSSPAGLVRSTPSRSSTVIQ
jgi:hypothetical protein